MVAEVRDISAEVIDRSAGEEPLELAQGLEARLNVVETDGVEFQDDRSFEQGVCLAVDEANELFEVTVTGDNRHVRTRRGQNKNFIK